MQVIFGLVAQKGSNDVYFLVVTRLKMSYVNITTVLIHSHKIVLVFFVVTKSVA